MITSQLIQHYRGYNNQVMENHCDSDRIQKKTFKRNEGAKPIVAKALDGQR